MGNEPSKSPRIPDSRPHHNTGAKGAESGLITVVSAAGPGRPHGSSNKYNIPDNVPEWYARFAAVPIPPILPTKPPKPTRVVAASATTAGDMTPTGSIASMASASRDGEAISVANWLTLFATPSPTIPSTTPAVAHTKSMYGNPAGTVAVVDDIGRATDRMLALLATRQIKAGRAVAEVRESVEGAARHSVSMMRESARLQASVERAVAMDDRLRDLEQRLEDALALAAELLGEEEVTFLSVPGTPITRRHTAESETT